MPKALVQSPTDPAHIVEIEFETIGSAADEPLLLVMGFTAQLTAWPDDFCRALANRGRYVIRFDNRDCGLSSKLDGIPVDVEAVLAAAIMGQLELLPTVPYLLSDMANDAVGLLDHLELASAHVVGASMGGMIAQTMAIEHPHRVRTLISIMSTTGDLDVSQPSPEAGAALLAPPPTDRDAYIANSVASLVWSSRKYRDTDEIRAQAARDYDRCFYPQGANRQLAAMYASGPRSPALTNLTTPTLVIHGRDDTLIPPAAGLRTAEMIPGANLLLMADMGHDLPRPLWPTLVDAIISHTSQATIEAVAHDKGALCPVH